MIHVDKRVGTPRRATMLMPITGEGPQEMISFTVDFKKSFFEDKSTSGYLAWTSFSTTFMVTASRSASFRRALTVLSSSAWKER